MYTDGSKYPSCVCSLFLDLAMGRSLSFLFERTNKEVLISLLLVCLLFYNNQSAYRCIPVLRSMQGTYSIQLRLMAI